MRNIVIIGIALAATSVACSNVATQLMRSAASRAMAADPLAELEDGLHLTLCGAGSPLPDPNRSGPCVAVVAGRRIFIVDAGTGGARNLGGMGLPGEAIEAVLLTHFHSDHIDGLGELSLIRWVAGGHEAPLPVIGPPGVEEVTAGFNQAYRADVGYRIAHHGEELMSPRSAGLVARPFAAPDVGNEAVVYDEDGLRIRAFRADHPPIDPAVGYRFDYGGRSIVISGDTKRSAEIERMAQDVDLLVHEALAAHLVAILTEAAEANGRTNRAKITRDILDYHTTPADAAASAETAGVGHLLLYHIVPPLLVPGMESAFLEGVSDAYRGTVTVGSDGTRISLPAGSDAIEVDP